MLLLLFEVYISSDIVIYLFKNNLKADLSPCFSLVQYLYQYSVYCGHIASNQY